MPTAAQLSQWGDLDQVVGRSVTFGEKSRQRNNFSTSSGGRLVSRRGIGGGERVDRAATVVSRASSTPQKVIEAARPAGQGGRSPRIRATVRRRAWSPVKGGASGERLADLGAGTLNAVLQWL